MEFTLKELVAQGNWVDFIRYHDGNLWYAVRRDAEPYGTLTMLEFPVPLKNEKGENEVGNATFLAKDKALLFMRYIRKYLEEIKNARASQSS